MVITLMVIIYIYMIIISLDNHHVRKLMVSIPIGRQNSLILITFDRLDVI